MKKFAAIIALLAAIAALAFAFGGNAEKGETGTQNAAYLRIHIRADSNEEKAQAVKYRVRDEVVSFLTPIVADCKTKEEAIARLQEELEGVERTAESVLARNGFSYGARASIRKEQFPTRVYDNVTLGAGVYDALILELGSGKGDNWWCVVYPPLCFAGGNGNFVYKSKIAEIIENFFS